MAKVLNVNPTRMELTKLKKRLTTARRGHKLLKDKRDELMRRFLDLIRENRELRERVEKGITQANKNLVMARAMMPPEITDTAFLCPRQEVTLDVGEANVMSVCIPVFSAKMRTADPADIYSYGFAYTPAELDDAVYELSSLLPDMLRLAEVEKATQMMAAEIEKTRRRVNALEHVMIPQYEATRKMITMKL
ncbi:MAG: V-type ATP synthase subunit D, partial [Clostridia bacterium]|nr:V-type ATP synthase subunit D [Clostridia bacterium]